MNGRCRVLGQKCLTFRSELKDAVLQFPEVLAVYWVKGIRCSTGNEKHQIVLPFSSEALPLIVRATRAAIRCIVPEVQQCGLDCHSRNGRRWPQAAQSRHSFCSCIRWPCLLAGRGAAVRCAMHGGQQRARSCHSAWGRHDQHVRNFALSWGVCETQRITGHHPTLAVNP